MQPNLLLAIALLAAGPSAPTAPEPPKPPEAPELAKVPQMPEAAVPAKVPQMPETAVPAKAPQGTARIKAPQAVPAATGKAPPAGDPNKPIGAAAALGARLAPPLPEGPPHPLGHIDPKTSVGSDLGRSPVEGCALPPALTSTALRDELRATSKLRQDELAAIARERASLEKLAADIAIARAALAEETAKLDDRVKKAEATRATSIRTPTGPGGKPVTETLAKTLRSMKIDQAATLVAHLERPLAVEVLRSMRPADAGAVLDKLKPDMAAELFALMASPGAGKASR